MAKNQRLWTQTEEEYIERYAGIKPVSLIANQLNRTGQSVRHKMAYMGLSVKTELDCFTTGYIANLLGCTDSAIRKRITNGSLRCKKIKGQFYISKNEFRKFYIRHCNARIFKGVPVDNINYLITGGDDAGAD